MRIIKCDRCGKEITGVQSVGYVNLDLRDVKTGKLQGDSRFDGWDFCQPCMNAIAEFVRMVPKPKAAIKKPIADGTKYAAVTPDKIERIRELAREGKTVKEIMEETGVSDPTVRKYKREVDNDSKGIPEPDQAAEPED